MPAPIRVVLVAAALAGVVPRARAVAQASPYISLDDPRLPLLEHLIARGDVEDPSPMVRPFRQKDAARVLAAADTQAPAGAPLVHTLRLQFEDSSDSTRWLVEARAGVQGFSHARRDLLHPAGPAGVRPYAEFAGLAIVSNLVLVTRPAAEPRIVDDPDWRGRKDLELAWRMIDGYVSAQFKYASLFYGQMDRNWGPPGLPGIGLSDYAYSRTEMGFDIAAGGFRLGALARSLEDERDAGGEIVHRYFFAHRLGVRVSKRLHLGLWETTVLSGVDRNFDDRYRNPLSLLLLANQYGLGADGNILVGIDARWQAKRHLAFQAQIGIDDFQYQNPGESQRYPNRWALTLTASGGLGPRLGWRLLYTQASSLVFRTLNPFENFTDAGVGIGRNFADQDQLTLTISVPARLHWLLTPELTVLRQGEGRINDPFPQSGQEAAAIPQIFVGVVERTYRAGLGLSGRTGPLDLVASAGFHHVVNSGHQEGHTVDRFEGRIQATVGLRRRGTFR